MVAIAEQAASVETPYFAVLGRVLVSSTEAATLGVSFLIHLQFALLDLLCDIAVCFYMPRAVAPSTQGQIWLSLGIQLNISRCVKMDVSWIFQLLAPLVLNVVNVEQLLVGDLG